MKIPFVKILLISICATIFDVGCDTVQTNKKQTLGNNEHIPVNGEMFYTLYIQGITDSIARQYKSLGVTSVESYVTWETCEKAVKESGTGLNGTQLLSC